MEQRRIALGIDHPDYLGSLSNLGVLLTDMGRYAEATPLVRESLESNRRFFGDTHTTTLQSMTALAGLLLDMGEIAEAEQVQRECLEGRRAVLGATHASTLLADAMLASIQHKLGKTKIAESQLRRTIDLQREHVGPDHPDTFSSLDLLIGMLHDQGKLDESIELSQGLIEASTRSLPPRHWRIGARLSQHGELLQGLSRSAEANDPLHEGYAILNDELGATHPQTLLASKRLGLYFMALHEMHPEAGHDATAAAWRAISSPGAHDLPANLPH